MNKKTKTDKAEQIFQDYLVNNISAQEAKAALEKLALSDEAKSFYNFDQEESSPDFRLPFIRKSRHTEHSFKLCCGQTREPQSRSARGGYNGTDIAIIGMSARFPGADNLAQYWQNICEGKDLITEIPEERWHIGPYFDPIPDTPNKSYSKWGGFLKDVDKFDPLFFGISPREAEVMDPQQRIFLEEAYHAIEDAGYNPDDLSSRRCGVFVGTTKGDYLDRYNSEDAIYSSFAFTGLASSILAGRISYLLNLRGPAISMDTACSSSLIAIVMACRSIANNECDMALAGGIALMHTPLLHIQASQAGLLSKKGRCKAFSNDADGIVLSEGAGVVMLKLYDRAVKDNDHIYGVIKGWGANQDGYTNGITAPSAESQADLERRVYEAFRINPETIEYVEAHGTGTKLGDPIEIKGLTDAFSTFTKKKQFCAVGSVKSNIGHTTMAGGVAGFIKAVLALKYQVIPPTLHCDIENEHIHFEESPFYLNREIREWEKGDDSPRVACVNSFGYSGTNAHVVIEEHRPDRSAQKREWAGKSVIIPLSAKNDEQLKRSVENLFNYITITNLNLTDIAYTLQVGREAMASRIAFVVEDIGQLKQKLTQFLGDEEDISLFRKGVIKTEKEVLSAVPADTDLKESIHKWIDNGEINKLAELWVKGQSMDWTLFYGDGLPQRVSLPNYPFARERYWVLDASDGKAPARQTGKNQLHPLVHENTSTFEQQQFTSIFTGEEFYLKDHQVLNEKILPGVAYIEMAVAATQKTGHRVHKLKDIIWASPIRAKAEFLKVHINLYPENDTIAYEVISKDENGTPENTMDETPMMLHGQGKIVIGEAHAQPPRQDLQAIKNRCTKKRDPQICYRKFRNTGFQLGPSFQGISELHYNTREVLASIRVSDLHDLGSFYLHPSLMDNAFQASMALIMDKVEDSAPYFPFVLKEIEIFKYPLPDKIYIHSTYQNDTADSPANQMARFDIELLNEQGETLVGFRDMTFRQMETRINSKKQKPERFEHPLSQPATEINPPSQVNSSDKDLKEKITAEIAGLVNNLLKIELKAPDLKKEMSSYGFDSIVVTKLINLINKKFNLSLMPTLFFEHSTLDSLITHLVTEHRAALQEKYGIKNNAHDLSSQTKDTMPLSTVMTKPKRSISPYVRKGTHQKGPIAVIGMAGILPEADHLDQFWENLIQGKNCITEIPKERWDWKTYYGDPIKEAGKTHVKWGGFIKDIDKFDPLFFNISPREAEFMDPQQRLFLQCVWHTIEQAGYNPKNLRGSQTGLYVGVETFDYNDLMAQNHVPIEAYTTTGLAPSMVANRISFLLDFHGPSASVATACSSSLVAIHQAIRAIHQGDCTLAIAGGVSVITSPKLHVGFTKAGMLCEDGRCKTFSDKADGYVRGEGVGAVMLKPLGRAESDHDTIYAVIKGNRISHGGHVSSLTAPNPKAQAALLEATYEEAELSPDTITYMEAHGTGTSLGDPIEINGLKMAFKSLYEKHNLKVPETPHCGIGSVKSNIGHLETASGIASIFKVILAMRHKMIPPTLNCETINPYIDLQNTPFYIARQKKEWTQLKDHRGNPVPRRAGVSSFGFGGAYAHIVLEEYAHEEYTHKDKSHSYLASAAQTIIPLSAKNKDLLNEYAQLLLDKIRNEKIKDINDLAYTLQVGRPEMNSRIAFVVKNFDELTEKLTQYLTDVRNIANFWQREIKTGQDTVAALSADEDTQKMISSWVAKGKLQKLAALWVDGLPLDWDLLYGENKPRRIGLPTYPFDKQRYWLPLVPQKASLPSGPSRIHPLIHENTSTLEQQQFTSTFSGTEFYLKDHQVLNEKILPGAAYLEMAAAAVSNAASNKQVHKLKDIVWAAPIKVNRIPETVTITLYPESDRIAYEISTKNLNDAEEDENEIVHSQGKAIMGEASNIPPIVDIQAIKARCPHALAPDACYQAFRSYGLEYGPGFQGISELNYNGREAIAKIEIPEELQYPGSYLHPNIVDSAFQAGIGLGIGSQKEIKMPYVPFALKEVEIFKPVTGSVYVHVTYSKNGGQKGFGQNPVNDIVNHDLTLLSEQGEILVKIKELRSRPIRLKKKSLEDKRSKNNSSEDKRPENNSLLLLTPQWQQQEIAEIKNMPYRQDVHIILMDQDESVCKAFKEKFNAKNLIFLTAPDTPEKIVNAFKICFAHIKALMEGNSSNVQKIIVLPSADTPAYSFAPIGGLLKTAKLEKPKIQGKIVQLPKLPLERILFLVEQEISTTGDIEVRYLEQNHMREVRRLVETGPSLLSANAPPVRANTPVLLAENIQPGGVYWIIGGLGGLGRIFAEAFIKTGNITVILSNRKDFDAIDPSNFKVLQAEAEKHQSVVAYLKCDVRRQNSVNEAVRIIREKYKTLTGIIHSAGIIKDNFIIKKSADEIQAVMEPKVYGAWHLDEALNGVEGIKFIVYFSSIAGALGNLGQADYSGANAFLDAFGAYHHSRKHKASLHISINWPFWENGGMAVEKSSQEWIFNMTGLAPLPTSHGITAFSTILANRNVSPDPSEYMVCFGKQHAISRYLGLKSNPYQRINDSENAAVVDADLQQRVEQDLVNLSADLLKVKKEDLNMDSEFSEYGFDSILMISMLNALEEKFAQTISPNIVLEHPTIKQLAAYLVKNGTKTDGVFKASVSDVSDGIKSEVDDYPPLPLKKRQKKRFYTLEDPSSGNRKIAVIGMACRLPQSPDLETFWDNLAAGKNLIRQVDPWRWDPQKFFSEDKAVPDKTYTNHGGFLDDIAGFDAAFFGICDEEAITLDPQHRIILELSQALFDRTGIDTESLSNTRTSVFIGAANNNYIRNGYPLVPQAAMQHIVVNNITNMMAARVCDFYNLKGSAVTIDTACSSSLVAVHEACRSIIDGESDMAVAGGIYLIIDPFAHISFSKAKVLSENGKSCVFDKRANGFVIGEGAGLVLLKDYEKALEDGDIINGVILGSAVNNDGKTMGLTVPNQEGQKAVIQAALNKSRIDPETITCLEAHGTGTLLGDPIEIKAATEIYRQYTQKIGYCALGAVKSNLGHTMTAAGITGLIKVLLAMEHKQIPPTIHCDSPHPRFGFEVSPFFPNTRLMPWHPECGVRRGAISSFGFGGTNCHVIVEQGPRDVEPKRRPLTSRRFFNRKHYWLGHPIVEAKEDPPSLVSDREERIEKAESTPLMSASYQYNEPYLADHLVLDEQVLLGVTYCSLGLDGIGKIQNNGEKRIRGIRKLLFVEPVRLNHGEEVSIVLQAHDNLFEVAAQKKAATASFPSKVVARGQYGILENDVQPQPPRIDIRKIKEAASRVFTGEQIYTQERDLIHGKSLQTILQIYLNHDHVLSHLELTPAMAEDGHEYDHVHPAILDGAITGALAPAFVMDGLDVPYIPLMIKAVIPHAPTPPRCYAYAKIIKKNREIIECDLFLLDDGGKVSLELKGFVCKRIHMENLPVPSAAEEENLFEPEEKPLQIHDDLSMEIEGFISQKIKTLIPGSKTTIPPDQNFMDLGLDSYELIRLVNTFEAEVGIELYPTLFFEYPNIASLARFFGTEHPDEWRRYFRKDSSRQIKNSTRQIKAKPFDPPPQPHEKARSYPETHAFDFSKISSFESRRDHIAVIGMAGVFAGSPDTKTFWHHLYRQTDLIKEIPPDHFDHGPWFAPERQSDKMYCKWGSFIDDVDKFDADFFQISPKEAELMDPQLRHLLQVLYHTAEDAGYITTIKGSRTGIFVGACFRDYADEMARIGKPVQAHDGTGNAPTMLANRPSFYFDLRGPSLSLDTACSSSLYSLHLACKAIQNNECEMAFAAGVNLILSSWHYRYFCSLGALSPSGRCHTFDKRADGYVPGEAVASVLLKPLDKAVADGDHIYGIIKGSAITHGGYTPSITAPSVDGEVNVLLEAWKNGGISPESLSYIEAHGTGTKLGDPVEINALKKAFKKFTAKENFCAVGSAKAHIGHGEGAAGIVGLVKVLLSMKHGMIPAMPDFKALNPYVKLDGSPFYINKSPLQWETQTNDHGKRLPRRAGISSFGFGGSYAHIVVEEYVNKSAKPLFQPAGKEFLIPLSAKHFKALKIYARSLLDYMDENENIDFSDMAYTLQTGREAMACRITFFVRDKDQFRAQLIQYLNGEKDIPGFRQGDPERKNNHFLSLTMDEDIQEALNKWMIKGKLNKLAEFWVNGLNLDWHLLYAGSSKPKKVSLPTYPFEKERFWLPQKMRRSSLHESVGMPNTLSSAVAGQPGTEYPSARGGYVKTEPLIGPLVHTIKDRPGNAAEGNPIIFESILSTDMVLIDHHRIQGRAILPGVAYIEIALEAIHHIYPGKRCIIKNIVWLKPIDATDKEQKIQIRISDEQDELKYELTGQPLKDGNPVLHGQGCIELLDGAPDAESVDYQQLLESMTLRWDQEESQQHFYKPIAEYGYNLGEYFQEIKKLWSPDDTESDLIRGITQIQLPKTYENALGDYQIFPGLLDAAIQSIGALVVEGSRTSSRKSGFQSMPVPFAMGRFEYVKPLEPKTFIYIEEFEPMHFNMTLLNPAGEVCVKCLDLEARAIKAPGENEITYTVKWAPQQLPQPSIRQEDTEGTALVIFNSDGFGFEQTILSNSQNALSLRLGGQTGQIRAGQWEIDPHNPFAWEEFFKQELPQITTIYFLGGLSATDLSQDGAYHSLRTSEELSILALFRCVKALMAHQYSDHSLDIILLTQDVQPISGYKKINPRSASFSGFIQSLAKEQPGWHIKHIDLCRQDLENEDLHRDILAQIMGEPHDPKGTPVAFRTGKRYIQQISPFALPEVKQTKIRRQGVYVILGGAGGLGIAFSEYLIRTYDAKMIWLGRRAMDDTIQKAVARLAKVGTAPMYIQADANTPEEIQKAVELIKRQHPTIHGIIHSAVVLRDQSLFNMTEENFRAALAPKLAGTIVLTQAFEKEERLDWICFFSSAQSVWGAPGQSNYAAGCTFEDAFGHYLASKKVSCPVQIINWGYWGEIGVAANDFYRERMKRYGAEFLTIEDGVKVFERVVGSDIRQIFPVKLTSDAIRQMGLDGNAIPAESSKPLIAPLSDAFLGNGSSQDLISRENLALAIRKELAQTIKRDPDKLDLNAPFLNFGIDSILGVELITRLNKRMHLGLRPTVLFDFSTINALSGHILDTYSHLIKMPSSTSIESPVTGDPKEARAESEFIKVDRSKVGFTPSLEQERYLTLMRLNPDQRALVIPMLFRVDGTLNLDHLQGAIDRIVLRHESLRTVFVKEGDQTILKLKASLPLPIKTIDAHGQDEAWIVSRTGEVLQETFDLEKGPLASVHVFEQEGASYLLVVCHHIISDGVSLMIFLEELSRTYNAIQQGHEVPSRSFLFQHIDYSAWERKIFKSPENKARKTFWERELVGFGEEIRLPFKYGYSRKSKGSVALLDYAFKPGFHRDIVPFCTKARLNPYTLFMMGLMITQYLLSEQKQQCMAMPNVNRDQQEIRDVIGYFVNIAFLPLALDPEETLLNTCKSVQEKMREVLSTRLPFSDLAKIIRKGQADHTVPPVQTLLSFLDTSLVRQCNLGEAELNLVSLKREALDFDYFFSILKDGEDYHVCMEYLTNLFEPHALQTLGGIWEAVMNQTIQTPELQLKELFDKIPGCKRRQKINLVSTYTIDPVKAGIEQWIKALNWHAEVRLADFNQIFQELSRKDSMFRQMQSGLNVIAFRYEDWLTPHWQHTAGEDALGQESQKNIDWTAAEKFLTDTVDQLISLLQDCLAHQDLPYMILITPGSPLIRQEAAYQKLEERHTKILIEAFKEDKNITILTDQKIQEWYPVEKLDDGKMDALAHIPYTDLYFMSMASVIVRTAFKYWASPKKVFILDCDNTLWGGIVAEDGIDHIVFDPQRQLFAETLIQQQQAGMLLALCSKNVEQDVRTVFSKRSDFALKEEFIVAMKVNWQPKSENIQALAKELNLGMDSFVFIDDNPIEIESVRQQCPEVDCLLFPQDPEAIHRFIKHTWFFDERVATAEDKERTSLYKAEIQRQDLLKTSQDAFENFLQQLNLKIVIEKMNAADLPRVSQLTHRTNQFNSTTIRRTEHDLNALIDKDNTDILTVRVKDRFGDYGLVGVLIMIYETEWTSVDSVILSCRVLGRGVEQEMLKAIGSSAKAHGHETVKLLYEPTKKNKPVYQFFANISDTTRHDHGAGFVWECKTQQLSQGQFSPDSATKEEPLDLPSDTAPGNEAAEMPDFKVNIGEIWQKYHDSRALNEIVKANTKKTFSAIKMVAAISETEKKLATIFKTILNQENVSVEADFFDMGGSSLELIQIIAAVEKKLGTPIDLQLLLQNTTIRRLASQIDHFNQNGSFDFNPDTSYLADKNLPLSIDAQTIRLHKSDTIASEHCLVTGVTGYVGSYLLYKLYQETDAAIYCLIRSKDKADASARLHQTLLKYDLQDQIELNDPRLILVSGDFSLPRFGLEKNMYEHLSGSIDHVFHIGARVNFALPYKELRESNVIGVKHIIEFCAHNKLKKCAYMSSTAIIDSDRFHSNDIVHEKPLEIDDPQIVYGYGQSKWIGEELMIRAVEAGMPVSIYRASGIGPSTDRFAGLNMSDTFAVIMLAMIDMEAVPDFPEAIVDFSPLDYIVRRIMTSIETGDGKIQHVSHPEPVRFDQLIDLLKPFGVNLIKLSYPQWVDRFKAYVKTSHIPHIDLIAPLITEKLAGINKSWFELVMDRPLFNVDVPPSIEKPEPFNFTLALEYLMLSYTTLAALYPLPEKESPIDTLILSCSTGSGHNAVAGAIKEMLENASNKNVDVFIMDEDLYYVEKFTHAYNYLVRCHPQLYATMHDLAFRSYTTQFKTDKKLNALYAAYILKTYHPERIIAVHAYGSQLFQAIKAIDPQIGCYTVITDWFEGCLPGWASPGADGIYCPSQNLKDYLVKLTPQIEPKCVVGNYPYTIKVNAVKNQDKQKVMERLDLEHDRPVITFCIGTDEKLAEDIRKILPNYSGIQFVIACYHNRFIYDIFTRNNADDHCQVHLYLENLIEYNFCSDLIFTKPGPGIVCESLQLGTIPVIMETGGIMPQEQGVRDYLIHSDLGMSVSTIDDITSIVDQLAAKAPAVDQMKRHLEKAVFNSGLDDVIKYFSSGF